VPQNLEVARQLYAAAAKRGMPDAAARAAFLGPPAVASQQTVSAPASSVNTTANNQAPPAQTAAPSAPVPPLRASRP